jgi:cobalamin biosynthesis protein CobD/CbiB
MLMMLSIFVIFIRLLISLIQGLEMDKNKDINEDTTEILFGVATLFTMIGMETIIMAFITGIYAILKPFLGLAISICLICLSFFFLVYLVFRIIYKDLRG